MLAGPALITSAVLAGSEFISHDLHCRLLFLFLSIGFADLHLAHSEEQAGKMKPLVVGFNMPAFPKLDIAPVPAALPTEAT